MAALAASGGGGVASQQQQMQGWAQPPDTEKPKHLGRLNTFKFGSEAADALASRRQAIPSQRVFNCPLNKHMNCLSHHCAICVLRSIW